MHLEVKGEGGDDKLGDVTAPAPRGSRVLELDRSPQLEAGDVVTLIVDADDGLLSEVYGGQFQLRGSCLSDELELPVVIDSVDGNRVKLKQPLRLEVLNRYNPRLVRTPFAREVGIEGFRFELGSNAYAGHHVEPGFNAIQMTRVANAWIRDLVISNADTGIVLERAKWVTVENVRFVADRDGKLGLQGHHGITVSKSADVLVQDVDFDVDLWHELTVVYAAHGNVFRQVGGREVNLDHHGGFPFENLFTNFKSVQRWSWLSGGGAACKGPHTGARGTFWGLKELPAPRDYDDADGDPEGELENGPWLSLQTNLIGDVRGVNDQQTSQGRWVESLPRLWPPDLYKAQLAKRRR